MNRWGEYKGYWDKHWLDVGPDLFVTGMTQDQYNWYYLEVFNFYHLRPVRTVFDLGCGTGMIVPVVRLLWPTCRYVGLDICKDAIDHARAQYPDEEWVHMTEPVLPGKADFIIVTSVFTHISQEDTEHYLDVIREALNPGGRAAVSIHIEPQPGMLISGNTARIDYKPEYFEAILHTHGLKVMGFTDGIQRYYEVEHDEHYPDQL